MSVLDRELFILPFRVSRYIVGLRTMDSQNCINKLVGFRRQPSFKLRVQQAKGKGMERIVGFRHAPFQWKHPQVVSWRW